MGGGGGMGSQKKKIIQEMFEVSAQFLDKGGGIFFGEFSGTTHCT